jgi:hypothetical protein
MKKFNLSDKEMLFIFNMKISTITDEAQKIPTNG